MLASSVSTPDLWRPFLRHSVWNDSFAWIQARAETASPGKYELGQPGWFAGVDEYSTKTPDACQWENHTRTVDLQFLVSGAENIAILPVAILGEPLLYNEGSDTQKFAGTAAAADFISLRPGDFVILMPGEAHRPKLAVKVPVPVRKLVIKIPVTLLQT